MSSTRSLHLLIYASRCKVAWPEQGREITAILDVSIRNNAQAGVSGLLLVHDGWFVQALEGSMQAVLTTYGRISGDPRHGDCRVLSAGPAQSRSFAEWHMCARALTSADGAILDALAMRGAFEPHRLTGPQSLRLLTAVRGVQDSARRRAAG
jgi:hypothetical protein